MALTDNPYIGLPLADIQEKQALYSLAENDILKTGKSNAFSGWSISRADLPEIRAALSLLRIANGYTTGNLKQIVQARVRTDRQFSGQDAFSDDL